jgi:hypothetical protein
MKADDTHFFLMSHAAKHDFGIIASADIRWTDFDYFSIKLINKFV